MINILIFIEDPGSANCILELPDYLEKNHLSFLILASGAARRYFRDKNIVYVEVLQETTALQLLTEYQPQLLVTGVSENLNSLGLYLIQAAQTMNIRTVGLIDASMYLDYRFRGNTDQPLAYAPDWLIVPDAICQAQYVELGYNPDRIRVCGHPYYEYVSKVKQTLSQEPIETLREKLGIHPLKTQKVILFAAETSVGVDPSQDHYSSDYTLSGRGTSKQRTHIVLEEVLDVLNTLEPRPYFILRLHPKNERAEFNDYLAECDLVSQHGSSLEYIYAADMVIGMTSMILQEAQLMNKLVLSVLPRLIEKNWLSDGGKGFIPYVSSRTDLAEALLGFSQNRLTAPFTNKPDRLATPESSALTRLGIFISELYDSAKYN